MKLVIELDIKGDETLASIFFRVAKLINSFIGHCKPDLTPNEVLEHAEEGDGQFAILTEMTAPLDSPPGKPVPAEKMKSMKSVARIVVMKAAYNTDAILSRSVLPVIGTNV